jgi:hypothetical protein
MTQSSEGPPQKRTAQNSIVQAQKKFISASRPRQHDHPVIMGLIFQLQTSLRLTAWAELKEFDNILAPTAWIMSRLIVSRKSSKISHTANAPHAGLESILNAMLMSNADS